MNDKIREQKKDIVAKLGQLGSDIYFLKVHMKALVNISATDVKEDNLGLYNWLEDLLGQVQKLRTDERWNK